MARTRKPEPPIYTFRVRILGGFYAPPESAKAWREIEVASNKTLADLGHAIPAAFDFGDPHLWSFFLSGGQVLYSPGALLALQLRYRLVEGDLAG